MELQQLLPSLPGLDEQEHMLCSRQTSRLLETQADEKERRERELNRLSDSVEEEIENEVTIVFSPRRHLCCFQSACFPAKAELVR